MLILDHRTEVPGRWPAPGGASARVTKLNKIRGAVFMLETVTPLGKAKTEGHASHHLKGSRGQAGRALRSGKRASTGRGDIHQLTTTG